MPGFPLSGIDANDPTPGILREIRFAQGQSFGSGGSRDVLLLGNRLTSATETLDTLGDYIVDETDCINRFGQGSEIHLMYRSFNLIPQAATIYAIAVTPGTGSGTVDFTLATTATGNTTLKLTVIGETIEVGVATGDTADVAKANAILAVNRQLHWPVTASSGGAGIVRLTNKIAGTRHDYNLTMSRGAFTLSAGMTVTKSAVTPGTTDDDQTNAILAMKASNIFYQVNCKTASGAITSTDNGLGEHSAAITEMVLPVNGKAMIGYAGLTSTQANATTTATSSVANSAVFKFYHAEDNDWSAAMIAAHCCAAVRSKEIGHPGANMTGYGLNGEIFRIPDPFDKNDRPTATEIRADLNNGVTPIGFTSKGAPYIVRDVTSRSWSGSSSTNDYRAREGHIPSVAFHFWDTLNAAWSSVAQDFVADDPAEGQKPFENTSTPRGLKSLIQKIIDDLVNNVGGPILDPSEQQSMKDSVEVVRLTDGLSAHVRMLAVKHLNKSQFLLDEAGPAY